MTSGVISGITAPVVGETPVQSITPTQEFTGTISWSAILGDEALLLDGNFDGEAIYRATVTLAAARGYTFEGVTQDFFTVAGAFIFTNNANEGVVTVVYDRTGPTQPDINLENVIDQTFGVDGIVDIKELFGDNPLTASGSVGSAVTVDRIAVDSDDRIVVLASFKVDADATDVGTGYRNSINIAAQSGNESMTSAAVLARSYTSTVGQTYTDWYLPSKGELNQLCKWAMGVPWVSNETLCIGGALNTGVGATGFTASGYWTSTENSASEAWGQLFSPINGVGIANEQTQFLKDIYFYIRPIRAGSIFPVRNVGAPGPGGGTIFYTSETPFNCGPTLAQTCNYLEAAPSNWNNSIYSPPEDALATWSAENNKDTGIAIDNHILFRLNANGSYDSNFGTEGQFLRKELNDQAKPYVLVATTSIYYADEVVKLLVDTQDRVLILLSGSIENSPSYAYHNFIARYRSDGDLDTTFGDGGDGTIGTTTAQSSQPTSPLFFADFAFDSVVQNGIIVAGFPVEEDDDSQVMLQRFNSAGVLDNSFGTSGVAITTLSFPARSNAPTPIEFSETRYSKIHVIADPLDGYIVAHNDFSEHFVSEDVADPSTLSLFTQLLRFKNNGLIDQDFQLSGPSFLFTNNILENFAVSEIAADGLTGFILSGTYVEAFNEPGEDIAPAVLQFDISEGDQEPATDNLIWGSNWEAQNCALSSSIRISSQIEANNAIFTSTYCLQDMNGVITSLSPIGEYFQSLELESTGDNYSRQVLNQFVPTNQRNLLLHRGSRPTSGWLAILDGAFVTPDSNWITPTISRLLIDSAGQVPEPLTLRGPEGLQSNVGTEINTSILVIGGTGTYRFALLQGSTLPPGLSFSAGGIISGTPTVDGITTISFDVYDDTSRVSGDFEFEILPASLSVAQPVFVPPTPIPYLRTLTTPKKNLKDGKLICTPGTYNAGFTLNGVIQGSSTTLFTPTTFTYNLIISGIAQISLAVTSANSSNSWDMPLTTSGTLITCSVTVTANGVTNTDRSSDNAVGITAASVTQSNSLATANSDYSAALNANSKAYQKALIDKRARWRQEITAIRANYYEVLARINSEGSSRKMISEKSTALKIMIAAQKKSAADYKASQPAAFAAKGASDIAALDAKTVAISKANAIYGTFIESIGYGVLIP